MTERAPSSGSPLFGASALLAYLASIKLLIHLLTAGNYGYFRDELYYIVASERLDLGYVDFPPLVAVVTAFTRILFGDSLLALHFLPALAGAAVVALTGLMARQLGGGRFAQGLAALAILVAPDFLVFGTWISMDAFDQLFWTIAAYVLLLILKRNEPRLWVLFGLVVGLGLLTKVTMLFFGFAVFVALLLTPVRGHLRTRWPWLGGAVALAFLSPYLYWQVTNGWPTLEFWGSYGSKVAETSPLQFLVEQILTMNPATLPIWLSGLYYYLFARKGRSFRMLGLIYVVLFVLFVVQNAKFYFLAPAYPALLAAGGLVIERFFQRFRRSWPKLAYPFILAISGIVIAPLTVVPVLPVQTLANITGGAGGDAGVKIETREVAQLPQNFADRFGWEEMAATVAEVYEELPQNERAEACILTGNYGEAGAIDFFGSRYDLPRPISGHNNYYLWGPGGCTGEVVISIGVSPERLGAVFDDIREETVFTCEYCMPDENNLSVYVSRDPKMTLKDVWRRFKHYD